MKIALPIGLLVLSVLALSAASPDPTRAYLEKTHHQTYVTYEDYVFPFLITLTAARSDKSAPAAAEVLRKTFKDDAKDLPNGGAPTPEHYTGPQFHLPGFVTEGKQGKGIDDCNRTYCLMKLHGSSEVQDIEKQSDKRAAYSRYVAERVRKFLTNRQLKGYEERVDNIPYLKKSLELLDWFPKRYKEEYTYLHDGFWQNKKAPASLKGTYLHQERQYLEIEKMQPVWRVGQMLEFQKDGSFLFFDLQIYTNHYFDSSFTIYEIIPDGDKAVLVQTDLMELDELKKSGFIRMLYKGKMQEAVGVYQKDRLGGWK